MSNLLSLYWCHRRPLIFSSPWAWDGHSALPFHFSIAKKSLLFFSSSHLFLYRSIIAEQSIQWVKNNNGIQCANLPNWNSPNLAGFHSSDHYKWSEWANATGFWMCYDVCGHGAVHVFLWRLDSFWGEHQLWKRSSSKAQCMSGSVRREHSIWCVTASMLLEPTDIWASEACLHKVGKEDIAL